MKKVINGLFYSSFYMAFLSIYCKISVLYFDVLTKSDNAILMCFFSGIICISIIVLLLRHLFQKIPGWV